MGETPQGLDSLFCEKYESKSAKPFASKTFTADQKDEVESVNTELTVSKSIRKSSFPKAKSVKSFKKTYSKRSKAERSRRIMEGKLRLTALDEADFDDMYPQLKNRKSNKAEEEKLSTLPSIFTSDLCSKKHATLVMHTPSELTKQLTNMMSLTRKSIKKSSC